MKSRVNRGSVAQLANEDPTAATKCEGAQGFVARCRDLMGSSAGWLDTTFDAGLDPCAIYTMPRESVQKTAADDHPTAATKCEGAGQKGLRASLR